MAAGGFEANPEMRARYLGTGWDLVKVRGSRYNSGEALNLTLAFGAQPTGHWSGCHAVLVDSGRRTWRPLMNIVILIPMASWSTSTAGGFVDEGEDFFSYTYAKYGEGSATTVANRVSDL
jgi:tricarballylate dehydrogenase